MMVTSRVLLPLVAPRPGLLRPPATGESIAMLRGIAQRPTKLQRLVFVPPFDTLTVLDIAFKPNNPKSTFEEHCVRASTRFPDKVPVGSEQDIWHLFGFPSRMPASAFRENVPLDNLPDFPILYEGDIAYVYVVVPDDVKEAHAHFVAAVITGSETPFTPFAPYPPHGGGFPPGRVRP